MNTVKLAVFPVLTHAEPGYMLIKQDKYALMGIYRGKQWWNISCYEIALEQKSLFA